MEKSNAPAGKDAGGAQSGVSAQAMLWVRCGVWLPAGLAFVCCSMLMGLGVVLYVADGIDGLGISMRWSALAGALACGAVPVLSVLLLRYRQFRNARQTPFARGVIAGVLSACLAWLGVELLLRSVAQEAAVGYRIGRTDLVPFDWSALKRHNLRLLEEIAQGHSVLSGDPSGWGSVLVSDPVLGWNVGPSRRDPTGLYRTSIEGLRSREVGESLAATPGRRRVALLGDSFTFGEEVPFEASWGYLLERSLGREFQVLNFGVTSHGIDQTLLKYGRDVTPWRPDVVIIGFMNWMPMRTLNVYNFLRPEREFPFSKPRFLVRAGSLTWENEPVLSANAMINADSIFELPNRDLDPWFRSEEWEMGWTRHSYIARYVRSRYLRDAEHSTEVLQSQAVALASRLMTVLVESMRKVGSRPVVVYFPTKRELLGERAGMKDSMTRGLSDIGVDVIDMTTCLTSSTSPQDAFVPNGGHYSASANAAIAACLTPEVRRQLGDQL